MHPLDKDLGKKKGKDFNDFDFNPSRRTFLTSGSAIAMHALIGVPVVFAEKLPRGLNLLTDNSTVDFFKIPGKHDDMVVLNDRPLNAETPPHLLDASRTPGDLFFIRNNGIPPARSDIRLSEWSLEISGESAERNHVLKLSELKRRFDIYKYDLTIECGGNGRSEFNPPASGNQWSLGAVGCSEFEGVRLKDLLQYVGLKQDAHYIGYYGADQHLSGDPQKSPISRGVPLNKALEDESLIAWNMNGSPLPYHNGYPLRLVFGGWPGSCSGKWLNKIVIRNQVHDGPKMGGSSYRTPCTPVSPGSPVDDSEMCIIQSMPVKSLITYPKTGATINLDQRLSFRGHAWAGDLSVRQVDYSIDFGSSWKSCHLDPPVNRLAWQRYYADATFPSKGYYELWVRATDENGISQPMLLPGWNPKGYLNNACHRIAIKVV